MAARTEARKFGSYSLTTANGVSIEKWTNRLLRHVQFKPMAKADGSIKTRDQFRGQEVNLSGQAFGTDTGATDANLSALLDALSSGEEDLQLFSDRSLQCGLSGPITYNLAPGSAGLVYDWKARFKSRFPTWRATSASQATSSETGAGPWTINVGSGGGDAPSSPVIRIKNVGSSFSDAFITLTHTNTLKQFQLVGITLAANQSVFIDMEEGRVGDGIALAIRPFAVSGVFFDLRSGAANNIEVAHTIGAGAALDFTFDWYGRFWTI